MGAFSGPNIVEDGLVLAPNPGDEVMYVDLSKERLENLYKQDDI